MVILWAILFQALAIILGVLAYGGIVISLSFFTKTLFFLALLCLLIALILLVVEKIQAKSNIP